MSVSEGQHPLPAVSPQGSALLHQGGSAASFDFGASDGFWQKTPDPRRPGRSSRLRKPPEASQWNASQSSAHSYNSKPRGAPVARPPGNRGISRVEQPPSQLRQLQQLARGASLEKSLSSLLIEEAFSRTSSSSSKAKPLLTTEGSAAAFPEQKSVRLPVLALSNPVHHPAAPEAAGGVAGPTFLWSTWGALQRPKSDELSSRQSQEEPEALEKELSVSEDSNASSSSWEQKESFVSKGGRTPKSADSKGWGRGDNAQEDRVVTSATKGPPNLPPFRVPPWQRPLIGGAKQRLGSASSLQLEAAGGSTPDAAIVATGTGMLSRRCSAGDLHGLRSGGLQARGGIRREASWPHPPPQQRGLLPAPAAAAAAAEGEARQPFGALRSFGQAGQAQPCWNLVTTQSISSAATRAAREAAAAAAAAAADAAAAVARRTDSPEAKAIAESAAAAAARGLVPPEAAAEFSPFSLQRGDPQCAVLIKQIVAAPAAAAKRPAASSSSANPPSSPPYKKAPVVLDVQTGAAAGAASAAAKADGSDSDSKIVRELEDSEPGVRSPPTEEAPTKEDSEAAAAPAGAGAAQADRSKAARAAESAEVMDPQAASPPKAATKESANGEESAGAAESAAAPKGSILVKANQASGSSSALGSSSQSFCDEGAPSLSPPQDAASLSSGSSTARRKIEEVLKQPLFRPPHKPWKLFEVQRPLRLKVVTLGPSGSGKSCLVRRFCERRFVGAPSSAGGGEGAPVGGERKPSLAEGGQHPGSARTIALDFGVRDVMLETGEKVRLHFIDLSGAPEFADVEEGGPLKGADVVLGVFSATEPQGIQPTLDRLLKARQQTGSGALLALVAAKASRSTAATAEAAAAAAAAAGVLFYEACAEAAEGVDELFLETAAKAAAKIRSRCTPLSSC